MQTTTELYQNYNYSTNKKINLQIKRLYILSGFNLFLLNAKKINISNYAKNLNRMDNKREKLKKLRQLLTDFTDLFIKHRREISNL